MPLDKDFYDSVYQVVRLVPRGRVTSYGAIARYLGSPRSARVVGWAMNVSHNAKPPVPAHRVLNRNGLLSGQAHFPGPGEMQRRLEAEGHSVSQNKVDRFEEVFWDPNLELSL